MTGNILYCAHCPYTTAIWVKGRSVGYRVMAEHVSASHSEEYKLVQEGLAELDEDIRRAEEEADGVY